MCWGREWEAWKMHRLPQTALITAFPEACFGACFWIPSRSVYILKINPTIWVSLSKCFISSTEQCARVFLCFLSLLSISYLHWDFAWQKKEKEKEQEKEKKRKTIGLAHNPFGCELWHRPWGLWVSIVVSQGSLFLPLLSQSPSG